MPRFNGHATMTLLFTFPVIAVLILLSSFFIEVNFDHYWSAFEGVCIGFTCTRAVLEIIGVCKDA